MSFTQRQVQLLAAGAAVVVLAAAKGCYDNAIATAALRGQQARTADSTIQSLTRRADSLGGALRVDTVRLRVATTRWRDFHDTLFLSDTVTLTRRESVIVLRADTVIRACGDALGLCLVRNAVQDTMLREWKIKWDARARPPGLIQRLGRSALLVGIGYALPH